MGESSRLLALERALAAAALVDQPEGPPRPTLASLLPGRPIDEPAKARFYQEIARMHRQHFGMLGSASTTASYRHLGSSISTAERL